MNRKRWWIAAGIASGVLLWILSALVFVNFIRPRLARPAPSLQPAELAYCEADPEALCVVSFSADRSDRMQIDLTLPAQTYPRFYIAVIHPESAGRYECETVDKLARRVRCVGQRTPLGEAIVIEVRSAANDVLLASGVFVVASIALPTPISVTLGPATGVPSPLPSPSRTPTRTPTPTPPADPVPEDDNATQTESETPTPTLES